MSYKLTSTDECETSGNWRLVRQNTGDVQPIEFTNGVPTAVTLRLPTDRRNGIKADTGIYVQDKWTLNRVTFNLGVRFDWFYASIPSFRLSPSLITPNRNYDVPDFQSVRQRDLTPKLAAAYTAAWLSDSDLRTRVLRGGAWSHAAGSCRSAARIVCGNPTARSSKIGFRVAMTG